VKVKIVLGNRQIQQSKYLGNYKTEQTENEIRKQA